MRPKVDQMSRTLSFHTHFSQIRYQIKAQTPTHMAKHTESFLCLLFLKYTIFFQVRRNFFGRVYLDHMLMKFEQNRMVQIIQNLELFDKNKIVNYFWQSVDAILEGVSVTETILWC